MLELVLFAWFAIGEFCVKLVTDGFLSEVCASLLVFVVVDLLLGVATWAIGICAGVDVVLFDFIKEPIFLWYRQK